jgi:hypothetical protein
MLPDARVGQIVAVTLHIWLQFQSYQTGASIGFKLANLKTALLEWIVVGIRATCSISGVALKLELVQLVAIGGQIYDIARLGFLRIFPSHHAHLRYFHRSHMRLLTCFKLMVHLLDLIEQLGAIHFAEIVSLEVDLLYSLE